MSNLAASSGSQLAWSQSRFWVEPERQLSWQSYVSKVAVEYPEHLHSEFNLVICMAGRVEVRQLGEVEVVEPGEVLIGNAIVPHRSTYHADSGECMAVSLTVSNSLFFDAAEQEAGWRPAEERGGPVCLGKISSGRMLEVAGNVHNMLQGGYENCRKLDRLGRLALGEVVRQWPNAKRHQQTVYTPAECLPRWQFVRAHEWMLGSQKDGFSVRDFARRLGLSESRFHHMFRASAGMPPARYFRDLVLKRASERLASSNDSVKEISYDLGFRTPSHFCALFKKEIGISPLEFRLNAGSLKEGCRPD